jgi:glutaminyl-tRNA synthetase
LLEIVNFDKVKQTKIEAPLFPADPSRGNQVYTLTKNVYIESDDFSAEAKKGFFGVMPDQVVLLRYGPWIKLVKVVKEADKIVKVQVEVVDQPANKVKGVIHWMSKEHSLPCHINQYQVLFTVENVLEEASKQKCDFTKFVNPESLVPRPNGRIWDLHANVKPYDRFQFERVGYFACDEQSSKNKLVFNSIVALKESKAKGETK